jgi:WXG100 family type VII secretion target
MADVTQLIRALESYSRELERHNAKVSRAYQDLERSLNKLRGVYEGVAAREFQSHWQKTKAGLAEYNRGAQSISHLLNERLAALKAADRTDGL